MLLFKNNKTGNLYYKKGLVTNTTNGDQDGQVMVLYVSVVNGVNYVREFNEFNEKFTKVELENLAKL